MIQARILIIDDNAAVLQALRLVLKSSFSTVAAVSEPNLIPAIIKEENIDVVLLDMNFGVGKLDGQEGLFWLDYIKYRGGLANPPAVVLITAFGDVALAVESLKKGADDFIQKPWDNTQLIQKIAEAIGKRREKNSLSDPSLSPHLKDLEREHIRKVLEENGGNVTLAARALDISRQTLYRKMKYYGLS